MVEWLRMGGYAVYVWSSFGLALAVIVANIVWPYAQLHRLRRALREDNPE
ncbi:MAG: heme exporter protein CcmD [Salinisphaera sp.]|nr:heme exporter protein CcmD [Salinisphaera sp.]